MEGGRVASEGLQKLVTSQFSRPGSPSEGASRLLVALRETHTVTPSQLPAAAGKPWLTDNSLQSLPWSFHMAVTPGGLHLLLFSEGHL